MYFEFRKHYSLNINYLPSTSNAVLFFPQMFHAGSPPSSLYLFTIPNNYTFIHPHYTCGAL